MRNVPPVAVRSAAGLAALLAAALTLACCSPAAKVVQAPLTEPPAPPPVIAVAAPPPAPDRDMMTDPRAIAAAQQAFNQLGYDVGKPDGVVGRSTHRVIFAFQKDHSLIEDGRLTFALADRLKTVVAELSKPITVAVVPGDTLIYSDGSVETAAAESSISWEKRNGTRSLVAVRPSTAGWPAEAKAGLDWAIAHAMDVAGRPVEWSSTGVNARFEIRIYPTLNPREAAIADQRAHVPSVRDARRRSALSRHCVPGYQGRMVHTAQQGPAGPPGVRPWATSRFKAVTAATVVGSDPPAINFKGDRQACLPLARRPVRPPYRPARG